MLAVPLFQVTIRESRLLRAPTCVWFSRLPAGLSSGRQDWLRARWFPSVHPSVLGLLYRLIAQLIVAREVSLALIVRNVRRAFPANIGRPEVDGDGFVGITEAGTEQCP